MNKKDFLKKLDKKLMILNDTERKDIINEYTDIIDNKISDGKTEEEAINEFGSVDVLAKEVLEAYKINTNYNESDNDNRSFIEELDFWIKKGAKALSEFTSDVISQFKKDNKNVKVEDIFEIILKIIFVFFLLSIIFYPLRGFGYLISEVLFGGLFSFIINFIWRFMLGILFIFIAFLVGYTIVRDTLNKKEIKDKTNDSKLEKKTEAEIRKEITKEEKQEKKYKQVASSLTNVIQSILKVFVVFWTLPFIFFLVLSYLILAILIFGLVKGIMWYGFILIALSSIIFFHQLLEVIYKLLFKNTLAKLYPFLIAFIIFLVGNIMAVDYIINFKIYTNYMPEERYESATIQESFTIDKDVLELASFYESTNYNVIANNELLDNEVLLVINYYKDYSKPELTRSYVGNRIIVREKVKDNIFNTQIFNDIIDNLKENKFYDLEELRSYKIEVYANTNTISKITIK
jgi:uncharacterized membrane protein